MGPPASEAPPSGSGQWSTPLLQSGGIEKGTHTPSIGGPGSASAPASLHLFGWVDEKNAATHGPAIPGLLSLLVHGDPRAPVTGLASIPREDRPPINASFQMFHGMVAIGMGLIALSLAGVWSWWRGTLWEQRWLLWIFVFSVLGPQLANQLGWFAAEIGRQPWIVYGLLRTSDGLSKAVTANMILSSLIMFSCIYALLFALFVFLLDQKIRRGPSEETASDVYANQSHVA